MFDINTHRYNYFYNYATVIEGLIPESICDQLAKGYHFISQPLPHHHA